MGFVALHDPTTGCTTIALKRDFSRLERRVFYAKVRLWLHCSR